MSATEPAPDPRPDLPPTMTRRLGKPDEAPGDATVVATPRDAAPGLQIQTDLAERFADRGLLGRGGMGFVLRVFDANLEREVAMKIAHSERLGAPSGVNTFIREARVTAQLEHPNVVPVHELGVYPDGRPYFVMRKIEGLTLFERLEKTDPQKAHEERLQELILILLKVCDGIAYAHSRGLIHCDLKPHNIMTGSFGEVYVVDWGIARAKKTPPLRDARGRIKWSGTPAYLAPEQLRSDYEGVDERVDVFGLGAILYAMLTNGRAPFDGDTAAESLERVLAYRIDPPQKVAGAVLPEPLCAIALRALARRPEDRYQTAAELREALERYLRGGHSANVRHFAPGSRIIVEGEKGDAAYFITRGHCQAYRAGPDGVKRVLRDFGPGDIFGEMSVLNAAPRTATVEATDDVTVHVIGHDELAKGLAHQPWLEKIVMVLVERFRELDAKSH